MALSASTLKDLIKANLEAVGANGSNLDIFCNAIATGIVMSVVGKIFTTIDTGLITGVGTGTGVGIMGLDSSAMKSLALSMFPSKGDNAEKLVQAITDATVSHLSSAADLSSADAPVFEGVGTILVGSIAVVAAEMSANIDSQLEASGAKGSNRTILAQAIGTGIATNIISVGTGTLTISGSITVPPPVSGAGTGVGSIA